MVKYKFEKAKFIKTAVQPKDFPTLRDLSGDILPEIAVAGRSNVGKSSLLNNLFNSHGLVKTSSSPGKTQALNFFSVADSLAFVDLPGYGYASVPASVRKQWGPMIQAYVEQRESLKLFLLLIDIRRIPNDEDKQMLNWILHHQKALILIFTKVDKVNQSERHANTKKILESLDIEQVQYLHYSTTKNVGRKELIWMIQDALGGES